MSDPKNKWTRPGAPPAPMFFGEKERNLVKQVNDELAERVLGQTIAYYPISIEESNFNDIYGEAKEKVALPPVRVFAYVAVDNQQTNTKFGYEYQTKITVNFHRRRLVEDQNLYVRVGDFVQYGEVFYEIVKTYNDTRYYFGQVEHKFQISAECVKARDGVFRVMPSVDRPTLTQQQETDVSQPAPRAAPYPPLNASYLTVASEPKLPNERVLTAGVGITLTDTGANGTLTIAASSPGAAGIVGAVQLQDGRGVSEGSSNLVFLTGSNRLGINTANPDVSLEIGTSSVDNSPAIRFTGLRPRIQFYETDRTDQYQIQASNGLLKWQVQNNDFDDANVKWIMNPSGQMAFRDGAAGKAIPARIFISGSQSENLLQVSSSSPEGADILVVTGSGRVGIRTANPSDTLTVDGTVSGSGIAYFGDDVYIAGTLHGGSPLKIAGSIQIHDTANDGGVIASMGDVDGTGENSISASCLLAGDITASYALLPTIVSTTQISASTVLADTSLWQSLTCSAFMSASLYYGDGSHLVNVARAQGNSGDIQYYYSDDGQISGSSTLQYLTSSSTLSVVGTVSASSNVSASYFYGDGRNLTNVTASAVEVADGPEYSVQFRYDSPIGREISGSTNLIFTPANNTLALTGDLSASANVSASYFYGDGSNLTGLATTTKGVAGSLQFKTGSADMTGSNSVVYNSSKNRLTIAGGLSHNRTAISTSHTASSDNYILAVTQVPTSVLFDATEFSAGQVVVIKDESGAASLTQSVTLVPAASQTIDGAPSLIIESPYGAVLLYTNGSNWFIY